MERSPLLAASPPAVAVAHPPVAPPRPRAGRPTAGRPCRLLATPDRFADLRERRTREASLDAILAAQERRATALLAEPTLRRELTGHRLLDISRAALERISLLGLSHHTTGDPRFARRAEEEMLAVAAFSDWNPGHFLDTAEMAAAVGIGLDWLHAVLPAETRRTLRETLVSHALAVPVEAWEYDWRLVTNNWNSVCFGGLVVAAAAIAPEEPRWLDELAEKVARHNPAALDHYAPDGVHPEGPAYWAYGTNYQVLLVEALRSAGRGDLGLPAAAGFLRSGAFMAHARGPGGAVFNFGDGAEDCGWTPALAWVAREAGRPVWLTGWRELTAAGPAASRSPFRALTALWWPVEEPSSQTPSPPRSFHGRGSQPVAFFRESWDDARAMYLAVKGGEGRLSHGHLDAGSFVFEADGVRWAIDPGAIPYHDLESAGIHLWDNSQGGDRWRIFAYHNRSHNTLTIDGQAHRADARAVLQGFRAAPR